MHRTYLRLKTCPRCKGDLLIDRAIEDAEEVCIQCGFRNFRRISHDKQPQHQLEETIPLIAKQGNKQTIRKA